MPDLLDGPVIDGRYPSHSTPPGSTVDLGEPVSLPAGFEATDDPLVGLTAALVCARLEPHTALTDRVITECVVDADRILRAVEKFRTPSPSTSPPLSANDRRYLAWLAGFDAVPPSAVCQPLGAEMSAKCRRRLTSLGYVAACRWRESHGYAVTEAGRAAVAAGGVTLADIDGE